MGTFASSKASRFSERRDMSGAGVRAIGMERLSWSMDERHAKAMEEARESRSVETGQINDTAKFDRR
jgi:hypothetical protein